MRYDLFLLIQFYNYDINSFFADIGGYMGLFLGWSIIHLFDVTVWAARILVSQFKPNIPAQS
jgi:hypothetical protein